MNGFYMKWGNGLKRINLLSINPKNGQKHSNILSADADELFECVWPFCGFALNGLSK